MAKLKLGKRIELLPWKEKYKDDLEAMSRLKTFIDEGKKYAIPILEITELKAVSLAELRKNFNSFNPPRSYYILNNNIELMEFCNNIKEEGVRLINNIGEIESDEICIY